jgi:hypothetical protein
MNDLIEDTELLREALEEFVLDREALSSVESKFGGFNIFEAIGHTHAEERHSNFLGFLLDPQGSHGLGDTVLREFVLCTLKSVPRDARPVDLVEISLADLSSTLILREHRNIDIFGLNDEENFVLVVENKIRSGEHSNQLQRYREYSESQYPDHKKIYVYLTPEGDEPSDGSYIPFTYSEIAILLEDVIARENRKTLPVPVSSALEQYLEILRRHIVSDDALVQLAKSIYQKHKRALDFIFEQRPDLQLELSELVAGLVEKSGAFIQDRHAKSYVNFVPTEWAEIPKFNITPKSSWTKSGRTVMLEFRNSPTSMTLCVVLGPTEDEEFRQEFFDYCKSKPDLFKGASSKLYAQYVTLYSKRVLSRRQLEDGEFSDLEPRVQEVWNDFLENDLPKICEGFQERFLDGR